MTQFSFTREFNGVIDIGVGNLESALSTHLSSRTPYVLADRQIWHGPLKQRVTAGLPALREDRVRLVNGGESAKTFNTWLTTMDWMRQAGVRRRDVLVVVGGGSLIDMGGFAAAAYLRGIPYVNIPTTLLAQADASIGGKVAINSATAKNSIGAFHHPLAVISDVTLLATLPPRDLSAGLAECVKIAATQPTGELFDYLTNQAHLLMAGEESALLNVVRWAVDGKIRLLAPDAFEENLERILNFGHTVGHAMETADLYSTWRHGEAVAIGMATACRLAVTMGLASAGTYEAFHRVLTSLRLPLEVPAELVPSVMANLDGIRRVRDGRLNFVLPVGVGQLIVLREVELELLVNAMSVRSCS